MDASFLWDSVAFVSYRELSRKAPICKKTVTYFALLYFCMVSSYKNMSKTIFEEMGRRKYRLSVHRKNEERRKAAPALRRVSVPSDLITAVPVGSMTIQSSKADLHPVVENQRMEDTGPFLVSFPHQFLCIISSSWDSDCSSELLDKTVKLWVTLRGFSLCGAWMEAYKVANKKATQKAKAMRKGLQ